MDRKSFKSKPYHTKTKHSGEIEKTIHSSDIDVGTSTLPADLHVYGAARFEDPHLDLNALVFGHRISVSGSTAIPTANVPSASVLYLSPHTSEFVGLYVDDHWQVKQTSMVTKSLSYMSASNLNYDVFVYWDKDSKVVDLDFWPWSGNTSRENVLVRKDGVLVKHNDPTRRYAGTVRTVAAGVTADNDTRRFVWNYYNRTSRPLKKTEATDSWTYAGTSFRAANNQTANSFEYVSGDTELLEARVYMNMSATATGWGATVGLGIDSTTVNSAQTYGGITNINLYSSAHALYQGYPSVGYHRIYWLEISGGITITWYGDIGNATYFAYGLTGEIRG